MPEILKLVDEEKIKLRPAVEISYLKKEENGEEKNQDLNKDPIR